MRPTMLRRSHIVLSGLSLVACATALTAQLPNASPVATGLSNAYTARARGYDAVAWNPANLAQPGNPKFSLGLFAVSGSSGLDPITLGDVAKYSGKNLPAEQRNDWLQTVTNSGGENGHIGGGVTYLGLSTGPFALQVASSITGSAKLNPDAFQAVLFGNAGRTGTPQTLTLQGSSMHAAAFTSAGLSYGFKVGHPKTSSDGQLSFGATAKYIVGNALAIAQDQGTTMNASNISVTFPIVYANTDSSKILGNGLGLDLGVAWSRRNLSFGATVQNVMNTFKWDESKLVSKPGTAMFNGTTDTTDFRDQPYANAPATLRQRVVDDKFKPIIAAGLGYAWKRSITLSADVRQQFGDELLIGPKTSIGGGIDYRWLPILRLRGGASYVTDGWGVSGGAGLQLGRYELGVGLSMLSVNGGQEPGVTLNVLSIH